MEHVELLLILVGAVILLVTDRLPPDGVGLAVIVSLVLTGASSTMEALAGISHPATIAVAAILILSAGVQRTGVSDSIAFWLRRHVRRSQRRLLVMQTALVTPLSAFLSNTATVAVFLPVILSICRDRGLSPSKFLIPLSYASLIGGMCTLIGTSTNIVVASLVPAYDVEPMRMFEFAPVGLMVALLGAAYLVVLGPYVIPTRRPAESLDGDYHLRRYLTEVEILPGSPIAGRTLEQSRLSELYDLDVIEIQRRDVRFTPAENAVILVGDVLLVRAPLATIRHIESTGGIRFRMEAKLEAADLQGGGMVLAEAVVPPGSPLDHRTLKEVGFRNKYGVTALAAYHHREYIGEKVGLIPLRIGDVLLLYGPKTRLRYLAAFPEVLSLVQVHPPRPRKNRAAICLTILGLTVLAAALGVVSLVQATVGGATLCVMTGCLSLREAYRAIDRRIVFLLAGMISLGLTFQRTGVAADLAEALIRAAGDMGPIVLLASVHIVTAILTELVTNNACAVIMVPIVMAAAASAGMDPRPFAFTVAFAASASFLTPFGYQTNMFVYGPGGYRFTDFMRVGLPLTLITLIVVVSLVPVLWPLTP